MFRTNRMVALFGGLFCATLMIGCAQERAVVAFDYVVDQGKGLPPGMKTLYILPAKCGPGTDEKWADMCATALRSLIIESKTDFGTQIRVVDREDTNVTYDEADMAAAGMSTGDPSRGGRITGADGAILADITVKKEAHTGKQRTMSGLSLWGGGGHGYGHGGGDVDTEEVETVTRNLTVQMEIKLLDTANNDFWAHLKPKS